MKTIAHGLVEILDVLNVPYIIGLGEGAGANILARMGMEHPQRCLGMILIHCTSTVAGVMEYFRDKVCILIDYPIWLSIGSFQFFYSPG